MTPDEDHWDEQRLAELFTAAGLRPAPPDDEFLDRLREQSTEAFAAASPAPTQLPTRRRKMFVIAMRGLAAAAAAAIVVGACFWSAIAPDDSALALGSVLENVAKADTVQLEITRDGKSERLWAARPSKLRWNHADGTYKIALGKRLWLVDEKANRATSQTSAYFRADGEGLDLLALLDLPAAPDGKDLLKRRPQTQTRGDDTVYRMEWPAPDGKIRIDAVVDGGSRLLHSLEATSIRLDRTQPIAKITVVAVDQPVDEELFVVGDTLTEDGRVGKVTDVQGVVSVRPVMHRRWTPVARHMLVKPGDWVRTDARGANAAAVRLVGQSELTLGPGSLVEVIKPDRVRLVHGVLEIQAADKAPLELLGPDDQKVPIKGRHVYRLAREKLTRLAKDPLWLLGFKGATANESIGSLVAKVEGRNVPLTVGYHKVSVDVRDQIARTVIEESFVNHTDSRLEGVFYFPLPQDASISGFGMWIGNELVEADVVEKQRAREIYETILRENRDPGLLEWSGGNMFKARVFPIFAHSTKRIKITYTQVLPLKGNRYRYSYALQSEMLKQHPLKELAIDVKISSVAPLASVTSPTHTARIDTTAHSAHVEFSAQEYTPTRDFEVVVETRGKQSEVVVIPHRRGEDGYFMMQLAPPAAEDGWQREILPDAGPMELLVLADTSGSIDADGRQKQAEFVASLLGSLTPEDKINLACCDVECQWIFNKPVAATQQNVNAARDFLDRRVSLGWTNLQRAFVSALKQCGPQTQVIYVGDGIVTTGDADPVAFGKWLKRTLGDKAVSCHAVTVSSSFEPVVLKAVASLGGGSVRQISGEKGPQAVALELLGEISKPTIRDLKVQFTGLRTARVYPGQLPNLAAGMQQILLGRYLPEGRDQTGQVIVTGVQGQKPVRFAARVSLADAEQGNSFIPRLWARMHLDALLQQGASQAIKDEIIALSEEYHIITPYTSLLVLESDADRERFKVKRRFQMRDGQKFFAEGRDNVNYELVQQQMKRAGDWRLGLRRAVLRELMGLGRDARVFQSDVVRRWQLVNGPMVYTGSAGQGATRGWGGRSSRVPMFGMGGPMIQGKGLYTGIDGRHVLDGEDLFGGDEDGVSFDLAKSREEVEAEFIEKLPDLSQAHWDAATTADPVAEPGPPARPSLLPPVSAGLEVAMASEMPAMPGNGGWRMGESQFGGIEFSGASLRGGAFGRGSRGVGQSPQQYTQWLTTLFPHLPAPPTEQPELKPEKPWPAEARALAGSLLRTEQLAKLDGGLSIELRSEHFDARWDKLTSRHRTLMLVSPRAWLTRAGGWGSPTLVSFCDAKERGVFSESFALGRLRDAVKRDLSQPPLSLYGHVLTRLDRTYRNYSAELKPQGESRTLLVLSQLSDPDDQVHVLIDTARQVVLSIEQHRNGQRISTTAFDQFVEAAGGWWAGRIRNLDKQGRRTSLTTQTFRQFDAEAFDRQIGKNLARRDRVQFLREPLVELANAKRAFGDGKASFDDHLALVLHFCGNQQWPRVLEHLDQAAKIGGNQPGMRWVRREILKHCRRREEFRRQILDEAASLAPASASTRMDPEEYFLANYLREQAAGFFQANEMLALLDTLRPVYERQPKHLKAQKGWMQLRVNYLRNTGQPDEALGLQEKLARDYPHEFDVQQQYAQALVGVGQYEAAYAWLERTLADRDAQWRPNEEYSLRNTHAQFLENQGRYPDLVEYLAKWIKSDPASSSPYQQYLSALIRTDRIDEANALIGKWLAEGRREGKLPPAVAQRLLAAVYQALGRGHNMHTNRIDEQWLDPLAEAVTFFARHKTQANVAEQIMGHGQFQQSDHCRRIRRQMLGILTAEIDTLEPPHLQRFVNWIWPNDPAVEANVWRRLAGRLQKRWAAERDPVRRHQLAAPLAQILSGRLTPEEHLGFLRRQLQEGPKKHRAHYANQLYNTLLNQPFSADYENEAFALLERLSDAEDPADRLYAHVRALYLLTDRMVRSRYDGRMAKVDHPEKLTRIELREKQQENLRLAREEYSDRLRRATAEHSQELGRWIRVERQYIETLLGRDLEQVEQECWELLGSGPPEPIPDDTQPTRQRQLDEVLRGRVVITLANLAARKGARPQLVDKLLKYTDRAIAAGDPKHVGWKLFKQRLLIALDRPGDLQKDLEHWTRVDDPLSFWRLSLGYLLAEQGKIDPAITLFEAVEAADELGPQHYRTLADWYMVVDRPQKHERALIATFKMTEEWRLSNWLSAKLRPWQRSSGQLPSELDKDVLRVFAALFEKSGRPQNYLNYLRGFYQASRDFRLLEAVPDAVVGHTAARVYPFLQGTGSVLAEVRDEATADSIVEHLAEVRKTAKTVVDHRALDLLELLVERRSSEVLNQPGPHVAKALAAMQRAFKREWSPGEPRLMAVFLAGLGRITQQELADEQLRELEILHGRAEAGSVDRMHIGYRRASCLWGYQQHNRAIDLIEAVLAEYQAACHGVLPTHANTALSMFVSYLEHRGHHARGESVLFEQLDHPANRQQSYWLRQRLYRLYVHAIRGGGDVSLGRGAELYRSVQQNLQDELDTPDHNHRHQLIGRLCEVYRVAKDKKFAGHADDLRAFAFKRLPQVLPQQTNNYPSIVGTVADTVHSVAGARDGLAFVIERIENEPQWFRYNNQDGWRHHGWRLTRWRKEVADLGDLEGRLLAIVLTELRRDLKSRQARNRNIYDCDSGYFWKEKEADFRHAAEEVYAQRKQSAVAVAHIAGYLYHDLHHYDRAIEILFIAHNQKLLDERQQSQLVNYLHQRSRYGESIAILRPLVELRPGNMQYRVWLMHAYFQTKRPAELLALLKQTDEYFHQNGRWSEGPMASLAKSCLDNRLYQQSTDYYEELISLHQRTHPRRGVGNGTLSQYYRYMSRAYTGLGNTVKAVDAACGAIVSWGTDQTNRQRALNALRDVLRTAPDLGQYVAELDKQSEETGQQNPIVRKALGAVYLGNNRYDKAIVQLQLALQVQPNDTATHRHLITCYDRQQDKQGALRQLLASLQLSRRDVNLYRDLGKRLHDLQRPAESERAYTSIVEMLPNESESHTMLAGIRQDQDRWDDAIRHWQRVAEIRALEPTGLLKLAAAQIHQKQWDAANKTLRKLDAKGWPSRFDDVHDQVRRMQRQIDKGP